MDHFHFFLLVSESAFLLVAEFVLLLLVFEFVLPSEFLFALLLDFLLLVHRVSDSYLLASSARTLKVTQSYIVLDETIFHPVGGGQPSDVGFIKKDSICFIVSKVTFNNETGIVTHEGKFEDQTFTEGEEVMLEVDEQVRQLNRRNHSAGHTLALATHNLNLPLKEVKGYHFPEGPYVEFVGKLDVKDKTFQGPLEKEVNKLILDRIPVSAAFVEVGELPALCSVIPEHLPENKPIRVVTMKGYKGTPCGGTHVNNTAEIGPLTIRKITQRKDNTRVSYKIEDNAPKNWNQEI